jgi:flagellar biosynthetic protein FliP
VDVDRFTYLAKGLHRLCQARIVWVMLALVLLLLHGTALAQSALPSLNISVGQANNPEEVSQSLQIIILLTVLSLAPAILIMTTAFTRIVIVLSLVRQAIGTPQLPPTQVIVGLSLILTFFVMSPTFDKINTTALQPYLKHQMTQQVALDKAMQPMRLFMFKQTEQKDLELFIGMAKLKRPKTTADVPTYVLLPAFVISELKTAFELGFMIFLPFLIIDVVVSSILVSMGMLFLPPASIALPFKIVLFVLVDGWHLICKALVGGFG